MAMNKDMQIVAKTHTGLVQKKNEDRYLVKNLTDDETLLAVADGMGGDVYGDVAADMIRNKFKTITCIDTGCERSKLKSTAQELDRFILHLSEADENYRGMGSTLICLFQRKNRIYWVHVGDSRLYHMRDGHLHQVTKDQTLARFLLTEGEISPAEYFDHYSRQVMDQCIGCGYSEPETGEFEVQSDDLVLLTSDGLHKAVNNLFIQKILKRNTTIQSKVEMLIDKALKAGGEDNITVILAEVS